MARPSKRATRAAQKQLVAALRIAGVGLVIVLLPHIFSKSMFVAGLRPLSSLGWLLLLVGVVMFVGMRWRPKISFPTIPEPGFSAPPTAPRRPIRPTTLVERVDPVSGSVFEPARRSWVESDRPAPSERVRPTTWGSNVFAVIEWRRFEAVVETLFAQAGFITKVLSHGPDEGVDVWLYSKSEPDGAPVSVVQCKHWQGKPVGVDKVRELRGVMAAKGVMRGQFATTSTFTSDAVSFGLANGIKLHDGAGLLEVIGKRTPEQQQALLNVAFAGEYWKPTCVNCGIKMIEKEPKAGGKTCWGCANFPKCRTTMVKRAA